MYKDGELSYPNFTVLFENELSALVVSITLFSYPNAETVRSLRVQTANESIVCLCVNASFEVDFEYLNGIQTFKQRQIEIINPVNSSSLFGN